MNEFLRIIRKKEMLPYLLVLLAGSFSLATFLQGALVKRGYGQFVSSRLLWFELSFFLVIIVLWALTSYFFSRAGNLDLSDCLRWDALSYLPLLVLFLNLPAAFVDFLNLEKTLLSIALLGTIALKFYLFNSKFDLGAALSGSILKDIAALLFLVVLGLLFFWRIISNSPLHQGSLAEDFNLFFPFRFLAAASLRKGMVPLWNPYIFSGTPFLADSQVALFHPVNLFLTLLAMPGYLSYQAAEWAVVINFLLAGVFTYLYARSMKLSSFGSLVSALVFAFGGAMVSHVRHLPILNVVVWFPLILLFLEKGYASRKLIYAVPAGIALGISILGGHLQMVLYVFYAVLAYGIFRLYALYKEERKPKELWWAAAFLLIVYATAFSTTAMQTFPTLELLPQSNRSIDVSYHLTTDFSVEPQNLIMLLVPNFFGGISGRYWGPWSYWWEMCGYAGILSLVLAALALFLVKKREVKFFSGMAVVSLLLALGNNTFLHPLAYLLLPGFSLNRAPSRLFFFFGFGLAMVAGYGADSLVKRDLKLKDFLPRLERFLLWALAAGVPIAFFLYYALASNSSSKIKYQMFSNMVNGFNFFLILLALSATVIYLARRQIDLRALRVLVVAVILFDLFSFGWQWYVEEKKPQEYYPSQDPVVEFLKRDKGFFRVINDGILSPNAGSVYRLFTTFGSNPLSLKDYESINHREDLLNVKYVLSRKNPDSGKYELVFSDGERKVFRRKNFTPRAFVPTKVLTAKSADLSESDKFDATNVAVIEGADLLLDGRQMGNTEGKVTITSYQPNEISLNAQMNNDGFVVLSEIYYPGWKAYLDGKPNRVYRADGLLRAVFVPRGKHQILMAFKPDSYRLGLRLAMTTWLVIGVILAAKAVLCLKPFLSRAES